MRSLAILATVLLGAAPLVRAGAQENYEIQVYPSETAAKGNTFFELHSNFTAMGSRLNIGNLLPTNNALHETLEITHGFTDNFEVGFYLFTSISPGEGWQFVGSHIRPRIRVPESWKWPVGVSLSTEFGPASKKFDSNELGIELRPIIDQTIGKLYWSLNPAVSWSFKGPEAGKGIDGMFFNPNVKLGWQFSKLVQAGVEYYGTTGTLTRMGSPTDQSHVLYPSIDLDLGAEWEFNAGYGFLVSGSGDQHIFKVILGRRFPW
jgi:hypothetical protein